MDNAAGGRTGRRPGFTLVELLVVVTIIGILAGIGVVRTRQVASQAYLATVKADLRRLSTEQALYQKLNYDYATLDELTEYTPTDGVTVDLGWVDNTGFAATAVHGARPGTTCGYFVGSPPDGTAGPATVADRIACD